MQIRRSSMTMTSKIEILKVLHNVISCIDSNHPVKEPNYIQPNSNWFQNYNLP